MKRLLMAAVAAFLFSGLVGPQEGFCVSGKSGAPVKNEVKFAKRSDVCMVTDMVPGDRPMFPVEVDGKTYYGCCPMCVHRLKDERAIRYAVDPVTKREVDKASAFITAGPGRKAVYFESEATAKKYQALFSTEKVRQ
ncbi:MAG: hypothetical protein HY891_08550 [Deltaproteobacteria bacterium]|nr:hypothetical protein [Deltaproteobacteria bacterium]